MRAGAEKLLSPQWWIGDELLECLAGLLTAFRCELPGNELHRQVGQFRGQVGDAQLLFLLRPLRLAGFRLFEDARVGLLAGRALDLLTQCRHLCRLEEQADSGTRQRSFLGAQRRNDRQEQG